MAVEVARDPAGDADWRQGCIKEHLADPFVTLAQALCAHASSLYSLMDEQSLEDAGTPWRKPPGSSMTWLMRASCALRSAASRRACTWRRTGKKKRPRQWSGGCSSRREHLSSHLRRGQPATVQVALAP